MTKILNQHEYFDSLLQQYGEVPVVRTYAFQGAKNRSLLSEEGLRTARITEETNKDRLIEFIYSTGGIKQDGNAIDQRGWHVENYRQNPVVLWCHNRTGEPIGKSINEWLGTCDGEPALTGIIEFMPEGMNPQADRVYSYYRTGFLSAVSASWKPLDFEILTDRAIKESRYGKTIFKGGVLFKEQDLLEVSGGAVPVDNKALQKRIQSGEISAEEFTMNFSKEYVYEDGHKTGLFYVDMHEMPGSNRTMIDMKLPVTPAVDETVKKEVETLAARIASLKEEGFTVNSVQLSRPADDTYDTYRGLLDELVPGGERAETRTDTTATYVVTYDKQIVSDPMTLPIGNFRVDVTKPQERLNAGAVSHGVVDVVDIPWNPTEARKRILEWATEDGKLNENKYRQAFGYSTALVSDSTTKTPGEYRLLHHDIVDGKLVTVRAALDQATHRFMRNGVNIHASARASVEAHLRDEYIWSKRKPPFDTTLGRVYQDVYQGLKDATGEELSSMQRSLKQISTELFGRNALVESWDVQDETTMRGIVFADAYKALSRFISDEELIADVIETDFENTIRSADAQLGFFQTWQRLLQDAAKEAGVELDLNNEEQIRNFLSSTKPIQGTTEVEPVVRLDEEGQARLERIQALLGSETSDSEDSGDDIMERILRRLEENPSRGPDVSAPDTE